VISISAVYGSGGNCGNCALAPQTISINLTRSYPRDLGDDVENDNRNNNEVKLRLHNANNEIPSREGIDKLVTLVEETTIAEAN
jgi:hypothetical protein